MTINIEKMSVTARDSVPTQVIRGEADSSREEADARLRVDIAGHQKRLIESGDLSGVVTADHPRPSGDWITISKSYLIGS
jgi:hypothetical protein